jgi:poly(hydroxyalkanoate) depolymerase family esterase
MVARMVSDNAIDPARIFVTGLSAGGAMTSVMLATYPDVFAGGAIIAGLPYGAANNVQQAFENMYQCSPRTPGARTRAALRLDIGSVITKALQAAGLIKGGR